jgi:putative membrane protein
MEKTTSGEIVPMVVEQSDTYSSAKWRAVFSISTAAAIVFLLIWGPTRLWGGLGLVDLWAFPLVYLGSFALLTGLFELFPRLRRPWILTSEKNNAIARATLTEFMTNGLGNTRDRTGIIIYISLMEKRVQIYADSGINSKVSDGTWTKPVQMIVTGIKENRFTEALIEALEYCGSILTEHCPPRPDDTNELDDLIIK